MEETKPSIADLLSRLPGPGHDVDTVLIRLAPSSTTAEWHTLVQTTEWILNGSQPDIPSKLGFLDFSTAFSDRPTPKQIHTRAAAEVGEPNYIFVATERTFAPLREAATAPTCTEEGTILSEDVTSRIELLVIDDILGDDRDEVDEEEDEEAEEPLQSGYALLGGEFQDLGSVANVIVQLSQRNMDLEELVEILDGDEY